MIIVVASTEPTVFFGNLKSSALSLMRFKIMNVYRPLLPALLVSLVFATTACTATFAQSDLRRTTVAVTYPLDESVTVKFRGTTLLPRYA